MSTIVKYFLPFSGAFIADFEQMLTGKEDHSCVNKSSAKNVSLPPELLPKHFD